MDPAKLKVVELRQELQQRGLDTKGVKAALVKRLKDALEKESKEPENEPVKSVVKEEPQPPIEPTPVVKVEVKSPTKITSPESKAKKQEEVTVKVESVEQPDIKLSPDKNKNDSEKQIKMEQDQEEKEPEESTEKPDENGEHIEEPQPSEPTNDETPTKETTKKVTETTKKNTGNVKVGTGAAKRKRQSDSFEGEERSAKKIREKTVEPIVIKEDEPDINNEKVQISWYDSDLHLQVDKESFVSAKPLIDGCFGFVWAGARANYGISAGKVCYEVKITEELKWEDPSKNLQERRDRNRGKRKSDHSRDRNKSRKSSENKPESKTKENKEESSEKTSEDPESKDEKPEENADEKMDTSELKDVEVKKDAEDVTETKEEVAETKEPENTSDTKEINETEEEATETNENTEKKDTANAEDTSEKTPSDEADQPKESVEEPIKQPIPLYYFRAGFSLLGTTLQLGEAKYSYAFESTGKFVTDKHFEDYGDSFGVGDVVGAYLDIGEEEVSITYTVNGVLQAAATTIPRSELPQENFALFPHVLSRNYAFELNFGNKEEPWFPHPEELKDYAFLQSVSDKVSGPIRPENRSDCELILMVGLSGSGKTHWVKEHIESSKDKAYTVIGNDSIFERMTVDGQSFKSRFGGSWKLLVDKLQRCLNTMTDIASLRRRNVIIDQTNVFPQAQNRKLRAFEGFKRKAVCLICDDEELARRQKLQESVKTVPESMVFEQKSQIELPHKFEGLELIFPDLDEEEAKKLIKKYHEERQQHRGYYRRSYDNRRDNRRSYYQSNNYRDRAYGGGGRYERYSQGGWGGRPSGNWSRERRDSRGPSTPRHGDGGSGWRPQNRGPRPDDRNRSRDLSRNSTGHYGGGRNQNSRNSGSWQSGGGGNWGNSNHQGYNQQMYGSHGYGAWSQQGWKYSGGQGGYSGQGNGGGGGGYGQQGYNYYGQYSQNQGWGGGNHRNRK